MSVVEMINPKFPRGPFRAALWDFDGTISLYRGGWQRVMVALMRAELAPTARNETHEQLESMATEWVVEHTGRPTIHQMECLVRELKLRQAPALTSEAYCDRFQQELLATVNQRMAEVTRGVKPPLAHAVAGVQNMLEALAEREITLILASGTEAEYVVPELRALGLERYFGANVYAPQGHDTSFSKAGVIERMLRELGIPGEQLIGFGDGIVETADVKRVGGCAVGVASDEEHGPGPDLQKRQRLIAAGADLIVPNYLECAALIEALGL